jgi:hypothetical protein
VTPSPRHEHVFKGQGSPASRVAAGHRAAHHRPPLLATAMGPFFRQLLGISHPPSPPLGHREASCAARACSPAKSSPEQSSSRSPPLVSVVPLARDAPDPKSTTNSPVVSSRSLFPTSPASRAAGLAGIRRAAPPRWPKGYIVKPKAFLWCLVRTKGRSVTF